MFIYDGRILKKHDFILPTGYLREFSNCSHVDNVYNILLTYFFHVSL